MGLILYFAYFAALVLSLIFIYKIVRIQFFWRPDERLVSMFTPSSAKSILQPVRGTIMAEDGSLLATSFPTYRIEMDPSVRKGEFAAVADKDMGKTYEDTLLAKVGRLSECLAGVFTEKTASQWYDQIVKARQDNRRNLVIAKQVDFFTMKMVKEFPLFDEGQFKGGLKVTQIPARQYPYGPLARSTIGSVADTFSRRYNTLELRYDKELRGENGYEYTKKVDRGRRIQDYDSLYVQPIDGYDIRTTIDINLQDIADRSLREHIREDSRNLDQACVAVMDVETGAIRAMVNLSNTDNGWRENYNILLSRTGEPGSVFKGVILTAVMADGYVKSSLEKIPAYPVIDGKKMPLATIPGTHQGDRHVSEYLSVHPGDSMEIRFGFMRSSNYTFIYLLNEYYSKQSLKFFEHLHDWHLDEPVDLEIGPAAHPFVKVYDNTVKSKGNIIDFRNMGFGYVIKLTPLHILMFYNSIANGGKMMKPYLVDSIEKDGRVVEKFKPVQTATVCSKEVADSMTVTMMTVTAPADPRTYRGTAAGSMRGARSKVAGKTGTSFIYLEPKDVPGGAANIVGNGQHTVDGRCKKQSTFVGFFPAENPKYSVIVTMYTRLGPWHAEYDGGGIPARVVKDIVNAVYTTDGHWNEKISADTTLAVRSIPEIAATEDGIVPELKGLGLSDAIYLVEKSGFKCEWSGYGKVASQSPAAGKKEIKGSTVTLNLK